MTTIQNLTEAITTVRSLRGQQRAQSLKRFMIVGRVPHIVLAFALVLVTGCARIPLSVEMRYLDTEEPVGLASVDATRPAKLAPFRPIVKGRTNKTGKVHLNVERYPLVNPELNLYIITLDGHIHTARTIPLAPTETWSRWIPLDPLLHWEKPPQIEFRYRRCTRSLLPRRFPWRCGGRQNRMKERLTSLRPDPSNIAARAPAECPARGSGDV